MTQTRQNWFRNLTIASTVKYYPSNFIMDSKFLGNKTHEVKFLKQIKFYVTLLVFLCLSSSLYKNLQSIINDHGNI